MKYLSLKQVEKLIIGGIIIMSYIAASAPGSSGTLLMVIYMVAIVAIFYFLLIRPQRNEQKRISTMLSDLEVGDSVVTTSGFYGVILDVTEEDVIVEFGNNKNCRIPMRKTAIAEVEKADAASEAQSDSDKKSVDLKKK